MRSVTVRRKESKPSRNAGGAKAAQIWETTFAGESKSSGFLITGRNLDDVICHISLEANTLSREKGLERARRIVSNLTIENIDRFSVSLRDSGTLSSTHEMPGWVYGLRCRPLGVTEGDFVTPNPFCRFRMASMVRQYNRLRFPDRFKKLPYQTVGLSQFPDGTGDIESDAVGSFEKALSLAEIEELIGDDVLYPNYNDKTLRARLKAMYPMGSESMKSEVRS
jgi:hypothetical protein